MSVAYRTRSPRYEVQEAEYEFMDMSGHQERGPFRTVTARHLLSEAEREADRRQKEYPERTYRVIDTDSNA